MVHIRGGQRHLKPLRVAESAEAWRPRPPGVGENVFGINSGLTAKRIGLLVAVLIEASSYCAEHDAPCATESNAQCKASTARQDQTDGGADGGTKDDPESDDAVAPIVGSVLAHGCHPRY